MAQKPSLDDLEKKIEQQQREIDELRRELEELREADRSFEFPLPKPTTPERPISAVTDGSFPGSIRIPGTKLSLALGGYAKGDIIHSFSDIGSAAEDLFVVPAIPTRDGDDDDGDRTNVHARETRLSVDARLDSDFGPFRAYVEGDFFGNSPGETGEVLSNSETFRLRRGFGDLGNLRVGQDWSTYTNPAAYPENLDFEVPGGQNFIRQGLIRWTQPLNNGFSIAGGVENPEARILEGGAIVNPTDKLPDFVLRGRYDLKGDYDVKLQAATVFRRLSADSVDDSAFGYGLQFSGRISVPWRRKDNEKEKDNFRFEANYGDGIGRYIEDVGIAGIAAAVDPASGNLDAVDAFGVAGSFQHWWTQEIRSTVLGSYVWVDNPSFAPDDSFKRSSLVETNLVWSPVPEVDLGWKSNMASEKMRMATRVRRSACSGAPSTNSRRLNKAAKAALTTLESATPADLDRSGAFWRRPFRRRSRGSNSSRWGRMLRLSRLSDRSLAGPRVVAPRRLVPTRRGRIALDGLLPARYAHVELGPVRRSRRAVSV